MNRRAATIAASLLLVLTGCSSSSGDPKPQEPESAGQPQSAGPPSISVPPSADGSQAQLVLSPGDLEAGTEVSIYGYHTDWDQKPDCRAAEDPDATAVIAGDGRYQEITASAGEGDTWWVLVAPGYSSECGAEGSRTRRPAEPWLGFRQPVGSIGAVRVPTLAEVGKPYKLDVGVSPEAPTAQPWQITVRFYGPFQTAPEATAAGCSDAAPVAWEQVIDAPRGSGQEGESGTYYHPFSLTPAESGIYRLAASVEGNEYAVATSVGCSDDDETLVTVE